MLRVKFEYSGGIVRKRRNLLKLLDQLGFDRADYKIEIFESSQGQRIVGHYDIIGLSDSQQLMFKLAYDYSDVR